MQAIDQSVHLNPLPTFPRILQNSRAANVHELLSDVKFTKDVYLLLRRILIKHPVMLAPDFVYVLYPVVDQAEALVLPEPRECHCNRSDQRP